MDKIITVEYDHDTECPMGYDSAWRLVSFNRNSIHNDAVPEYITEDGKPTLTLRNKLRVGLAYQLSYYEHGNSRYDIAGSGPACPWDSVGNAGILVWEHAPGELAKSPADRRKDAECFLETYNDWMNGWVCFYSVETADGEPVDSCGGFYMSDSSYMSEQIAEHLEPGDRVIITGQCEDAFDRKKLPTGVDEVDEFEEEEYEYDDEPAELVG